MRCLVSLTASRNNLDTVPRSMYKLKKLKFLYLDNNQLVEIEEDIRLLHQLRVLDISNNKLITLPKSLYRLAKLQNFNVKGNYNLTRTGAGSGGQVKGQVDSVTKNLRSEFSKKKSIINDECNHYKDAVSGSENSSNRTKKGVIKSMNFDKDVMGNESKHRQFEKTNSNKISGHAVVRKGDSLRSSKVALDREQQAKQGDSYLLQQRLLKGQPIISRVDSDLMIKQAKTRPTLQSGQETNMPRKFHSMKVLKELLFGKSKKTVSVRSDFGGSDPYSSKHPNQFPHDSHIDQLSYRGRSQRNSPVTRRSTLTRSSSNPRSHGKLAWPQNGISVKSDHEPYLTNRTEFVISSHRKNDADAKSDSYGYGTWRSRGCPYDFETESILQSDKSTFVEQEYNERSQDFQHDSLCMQGNNHYLYSRDGPNRSTLSIDAAASGIVYIPHHQQGQLRSKIHQKYYTNHNKGQCHYSDSGAYNRNEQIDNGCPCLRPYNQYPCKGQSYRSGDDRSTISSEHHSFSPRYSVSHAQASFTHETNLKHRQHLGDLVEQISPKYSTQSAVTRHDQTVREVSTSAAGKKLRDDTFNSKQFPYEYTGQGQNKCFPDGQPAFHTHHSYDREPSQTYKNDSMPNFGTVSDCPKNCHRSYRNQSKQGREKYTKEHYATDTTQSRDEDRSRSRHGFPEFNHVLITKDIPKVERKQSGKCIKEDDIKNGLFSENACMKIHIDDTKAGIINSTLTSSRSMDSLMDLAAGRTSNYQHVSHQKGPTSSARSLAASSELKDFKNPHRGDTQEARGVNHSRTDYTLLGVCNQVETLLNRNLLQPVIGFNHHASRSFAEKTIREKATGLWRLDKSKDVTRTNVIDDVGIEETELPGLVYSQPQTFTVTSEGGQFVSSDGSMVAVNMPTHATSKTLHINIQLLFIPPAVISKVREFNYFVTNIIAVGPVVNFYTGSKTDLNSPATVTIPAPADVKGGHLVVLTVRRDNSCIPCSSGYRSGKLSATLSTWHFAGKVALITQAKCKYKACKSMEQLLHCTGATLT